MVFKCRKWNPFTRSIRAEFPSHFRHFFLWNWKRSRRKRRWTSRCLNSDSINVSSLASKCPMIGLISSSIDWHLFLPFPFKNNRKYHGTVEEKKRLLHSINQTAVSLPRSEVVRKSNGLKLTELIALCASVCKTTKLYNVNMNRALRANGLRMPQRRCRDGSCSAPLDVRAFSQRVLCAIFRSRIIFSPRIANSKRFVDNPRVKRNTDDDSSALSKKMILEEKIWSFCYNMTCITPCCLCCSFYSSWKKPTGGSESEQEKNRKKYSALVFLQFSELSLWFPCRLSFSSQAYTSCFEW